MVEQNNKSNIKAEVKSIIIVIFFALLFRFFVIELFYVPTGSMQATILEHEYLFSTKYSYGYSKHSLPFSPDLFRGRIFSSMPQRGDIIIMRPPHDMNTRYIKRLIGLPGDKIEIRKNVTYINDQPVARVNVGIYIDHDNNNREYVKYKETLPSGISFYTYKLKLFDHLLERNHSNFGPYFVPEGHLFFLGDNRDDSKDSRYNLGFVPMENLIAKAQFVLFSTSEELWKKDAGFWEQIARIWTWISSIRFNRLFVSLYENDN